MAFTIPNELDAFNTNQAEVDSKDIDILAAGMAQSGVVSGCAVTQQAVPNVGVTVAAGTIIYNKTWATVAGGNLALSAPDATNPRFDLIVSNSSGTTSVVAGTPLAEPVFPAIPASSVVLAAVYVPANETTILNNRITDKRVIVTEPRFFSGDIQPQGNITGSPGNVASRVDFGTRSMNATPAAGEIENRLAILLAATGRLGLDVNNPGKLIKLSLTGATQYSHLIDINHTNTSGVGDSTAILVVTDVDVADTGAGVSIRNKGKADGLYIAAEGRSTGTVGALGIGLDVNRQWGTSNEQNGAAANTGILITNWTSSTNNGVCIQLTNANASCLAPLLSGNSNGATAQGTPLNAGGNANSGFILFDNTGTPRFFVTYGGVLTAEKASFVSQPRARVFLSSATQSINSGTDTSINFDGETTDVGTMHDTVTNNSRITVPSGGGGTYILSCSVEFAANATGFRQVRFFKNGSTPLGFATSPNLGGSDVVRLALTTAADLAATDYVEVQVYQNSGGALNVNGTNSYTTWFTVTKAN